MVKAIKRVKGRTLVPLPGLFCARKKAGRTQRELAKLAGMTQPSIARIEGGELATLQTLGKLMGALGVERIEELTSEPPEVQLAKLDDDSEGIESEYVSRYRMGGEHADAHYEDTIAEERLRRFREAGSTDDAFREIARELFQLGKARERDLAEAE